MVIDLEGRNVSNFESKIVSLNCNLCKKMDKMETIWLENEAVG
jgi:hypothetical protein